MYKNLHFTFVSSDLPRRNLPESGQVDCGMQCPVWTDICSAHFDTSTRALGYMEGMGRQGDRREYALYIVAIAGAGLFESSPGYLDAYLADFSVIQIGAEDQ